ncbi:MAG: hypothetical protein VZR23_04300 [Lachnospiraceae bacterium]|jgi:hypothetical protein|nr:hypothetical protein [Lachnospiraceae bacterium]
MDNMNINDKESDLYFIKESLLFLKQELHLENRSVAFECLEKGITFEELRNIENYFFELNMLSIEEMPELNVITDKIREIVDFEKFSNKAAIDLLLVLYYENRIPCMSKILKKNGLNY